MKVLSSARPSPALIVAAAALTFALAGTSIAADPVAKVTKKTVKKIANQEIGKRAPGLSVDKAKSADSATTATTAATALSANNATALGGINSAGYVQVKAQRLRVESDDTVDSDYGSGTALIDLTNLAGGQYLLQGKVMIDNDSGGDEAVTCTLVNDIGPTILDSARQSPVAGQELEFTLMGSTSASAGGTDDIVIRCTNPGNDNDADHLKITAQLINN